MIEAGDVVVVLFIGARETKRRSAIVLSSPDYNGQKTDLILAMVTSNIELA